MDNRHFPHPAVSGLPVLDHLAFGSGRLPCTRAGNTRADDHLHQFLSLDARQNLAIENLAKLRLRHPLEWRQRHA